jgi:hypothetical protein
MQWSELRSLSSAAAASLDAKVKSLHPGSTVLTLKIKSKAGFGSKRYCGPILATRSNVADLEASLARALATRAS